MDNREKESLLALARSAALKAGATIMPYYRSAVKTWDKSPDNPVTTADLAADRQLRDLLVGATPAYGWLSEETADTPTRLDKCCVWVVDPIDGTQEFIEGIDQFAVSVALVVQTRAVLGVVYNPATDELVSALADGTLCLNDTSVTPPSPHSDPAGARILVSDTEVKKGMWAPYQENLTLEQVGSAAYKLALVALGRGDAYISLKPKHEWDICAGVALVEAAGGVVSDLHGNAIRFNQPDVCVDGLIAAGPELYPRLLDLLSGGALPAIRCR